MKDGSNYDCGLARPDEFSTGSRKYACFEARPCKDLIWHLNVKLVAKSGTIHGKEIFTAYNLELVIMCKVESQASNALNFYGHIFCF